MSEPTPILTLMTSPVPALLTINLFLSFLLLRSAARLLPRSGALAVLSGVGGVAGLAWVALALSGRLSAVLGVGVLGSAFGLWAAQLLLFAVVATVQLLPELTLMRCPACGLPVNPRAEESTCWRCVRATMRAHSAQRSPALL